MAVSQKPCVNCCLYTRADQKMCQHYDPTYGHHVWEAKAEKLKSPAAERLSEPATHRKPTQLDLAEYDRWLANQQTDRAHVQ